MAGNYGTFGNFNMGGYGYTAPYNAGFQQPQPQLRTNKVFVTSLEDALGRNAEPNTIMVYRHQDEKFEYEIFTDVQGKKSYKTLVLTDYSTVEQRKEDTRTNYTPEALIALQGKIEALEGRFNVLEEELAKKKNTKETKRVEATNDD